jgi:hypothetical protein
MNKGQIESAELFLTEDVADKSHRIYNAQKD